MQFEELYETFFVRVYNYARYRCETDTEAEDLTSCIFEKLCKEKDKEARDKLYKRYDTLRQLHHQGPGFLLQLFFGMAAIEIVIPRILPDLDPVPSVNMTRA